MTKTITLEQLQRVTLKCQGLGGALAFGQGKKAVLAALERLGYVQIDTISVVERAHHHTLWTRVPGYKNEYLEQLVDERKVFEYWFHAASYLPMINFRYALPRMLQFKEKESFYHKHVDPKTLRYVYDQIRLDGPKKARDFQSSRQQSGTWWNWKPAKVALEKLFMQGDLMICGRDGMEKRYDITERVLPSTVNTSEPTPSALAEHLVRTYLRAYGVTTIKQITHLRTGKELKKNAGEILQAMLEDKTIQQVDIDGMPTLYVLSKLLENTIEEPSHNVKLLSPFDNAIIHRDRTEQLFDFNYRLECYTPKEKRQYGYFCLPILLGNKFIGRIDCKAHRKREELEILHLHVENTELDTDIWLDHFIEAAVRFANFNNCKSIKLTKVSPKAMAKTIKQAFNRNGGRYLSVSRYRA
ncbi:winged helix-turn-helix domain-containing protein [Tunicatimonas pelagia]|uniref:winged helix-turn-helix domain-containing protein n=1 Tax=Tunicatimonas pelagia TaxID=931531 RepID=UPI0026660B45|nr:crosslink repair DNA glycosylase YcaQ family protein [Tunicatimonas pelagia]WKN45909.1 crosslink repair DNA glycosylase YcaQ family protein [Tunicatimonas pelagia]